MCTSVCKLALPKNMCRISDSLTQDPPSIHGDKSQECLISQSGFISIFNSLALVHQSSQSHFECRCFLCAACSKTQYRPIYE